MIELRVPETLPDHKLNSYGAIIKNTIITYFSPNGEEHIVFDYVEMEEEIDSWTRIENGNVVIKIYHRVTIELHWNDSLERLEVYISRDF